MTEQMESQIIDNQLMTLKKLDQLIALLTNLTNTIIKYDEDYQKEIAEEMRNASSFVKA